MKVLLIGSAPVSEPQSHVTDQTINVHIKPSRSANLIIVHVLNQLNTFIFLLPLVTLLSIPNCRSGNVTAQMRFCQRKTDVSFGTDLLSPKCSSVMWLMPQKLQSTNTISTMKPCSIEICLNDSVLCVLVNIWSKFNRSDPWMYRFCEILGAICFTSPLILWRWV